MDENEMKDKDLILKILRENGPMTTNEFDAYIQEHKDEIQTSCPDSSLRKLIWMKRQGFIKGKPVKEKKGWEWWVEE